MKNKLKRILPILVFLIGVLILLYPIASNIYYEKVNQKEEEIYLQSAKKFKENYSNNGNSSNIDGKESNKNDLGSELERCKKYNEKINKERDLKDPFSENEENNLSDEYMNLLNFDEDGKMGYLKIPVIDTTLPIYHTTEESVLQVGVGHLEGSSLPIGGKSTHAILSAHNGLLDRKLFADLEKVIKGDIFIVNVLGEKLMYRVSDINVVLPNETEELKVVDGKDYITLVTCTPYGENSHRLLVRGSRIDYDDLLVEENKREIESSWKKEYVDALKIAVPVFLVFVVIKIIRDKKA